MTKNHDVCGLGVGGWGLVWSLQRQEVGALICKKGGMISVGKE